MWGQHFVKCGQAKSYSNLVCIAYGISTLVVFAKEKNVKFMNVAITFITHIIENDRISTIKSFIFLSWNQTVK